MARMSLTGPLGLSVAAISLAAVSFFTAIPSLVSTAFASTGKPFAVDAWNRQLTESHDRASLQWQKRINGRSLFFHPIQPPPPTSRIQQPVETRPIEVPEPVVETRYVGPSLIALVGRRAWFKPAARGEGPLMLSVGEESHGLKLVDTDAPWTAQVLFNDHPYTLTLFDSQRTEPYLKPGTFADQPVRGLKEAPPSNDVDPDLFGLEGGDL